MIKKVLGLIVMVIATHSANAEVYVQVVNTLLDSSTQVKPGTYSTYNFTLAKGDVMVVDLKVAGGLDNSLTVQLLDLPNFQRRRAGQKYRVFDSGSAQIKSSFSYRFEAPGSNIYYLVLDNTRASLASRNVQSYVYKAGGSETEESINLKKIYGDFYQMLKALFIFDDFDIYVQKCGQENAFSTPDIVICHELNKLLVEERVPRAMIFVLLHEAAHSLLNLWDYPLYDNEDAADELATIMLLLGGQPEAALDAAKWWAGRASSQSAVAKLWVDDRHTLSPQRARNIINWLNNEDELKRRWLNLLILKMTDDVLRASADDSSAGEKAQAAAIRELEWRQAVRIE